MSFSSNSDKSDSILEESTKIPLAEEYVVLRVPINNSLTFNNHLKQFCNKVASKLYAPTKVAQYLDHNRIKLIYNPLFKGQVSYCPLI